MEQERLSDERMSALDASIVETGTGAENADELPASDGPGGKYVYRIIRHQASRDFGDIWVGGSARGYTVHHAELRRRLERLGA